MTKLRCSSQVGEDPGHVQRPGRLEPEVELLDDGLGERLDQGRRVGNRPLKTRAWKKQ